MRRLCEEEDESWEINEKGLFFAYNLNCRLETICENKYTESGWDDDNNE